MRAQHASVLRFPLQKFSFVSARSAAPSQAGIRRDFSREIASVLIEPLEPRQLLSTYYVSPAGYDSAAGTAVSAPWKTIGRVNAQTLRAGDKVLFQGGKSFSGSLYVPSREGGTFTSRVTFSTYGAGRAIINSGSKPGIDVAQAGGIDISNLKFVGNGMYNNASSGIYVHVDWASKIVSGFNIKNVEVSGYGREGIRFVSGGSNSSINDVNVSYSDSHDNLYGGLKANNNRISGMKNYVIDHVRAWNNPGSKTAGGVTGSGIFLEGIAGARISRSVAHHNGKDGAAPVGIWAAMGERVIIEYNESYANNTRTISDGGGFDFDWDVKNSVMQYNYSHDNAGPGYILAGGTHYNTSNVIRYNVSENDGRKNGRAGMQLWGNVTNSQIYNNVVYITPTGSSNTAGFYAHDSGTNGKRPQNVIISNNIFYTTNSTKVLNITSGVAAYGSLKFTGNAYYTSGGTFKIQWGGTSYSSLTAWRNAKGQEKVNGIAAGYQGDPKLVAAGQGQTIGDAHILRSLTAYKLQSSSPLINIGVTQPGTLASAITDFWGDALPKGGKYDIGVDEVA